MLVGRWDLFGLRIRDIFGGELEKGSCYTKNNSYVGREKGPCWTENKSYCWWGEGTVLY